MERLDSIRKCWPLFGEDVTKAQFLVQQHRCLVWKNRKNSETNWVLPPTIEDTFAGSGHVDALKKLRAIENQTEQTPTAQRFQQNHRKGSGVHKHFC